MYQQLSSSQITVRPPNDCGLGRRVGVAKPPSLQDHQQMRHRFARALRRRSTRMGTDAAPINDYTEERSLPQQQNPHHALDDEWVQCNKGSPECSAFLAAPYAPLKPQGPVILAQNTSDAKWRARVSNTSNKPEDGPQREERRCCGPLFACAVCHPPASLPVNSRYRA